LIVRLLFDENLAARLVHVLADVYPESQHVEKALGRGATDDAIWAYARSSGLLLVTKDEDFERLSVWRGAPPRVVWIRTGNGSTSDVADLLRRNRDLIADFLAHEEATFLALG
jgi:predicted nuclease of predicted toxin-antitoxin system